MNTREVLERTGFCPFGAALCGAHMKVSRQWANPNGSTVRRNFALNKNQTDTVITPWDDTWRDDRDSAIKNARKLTGVFFNYGIELLRERIKSAK